MLGALRSKQFECVRPPRARTALRAALVVTATAAVTIIVLATSGRRTEPPAAVDIEPHSFAYRLSGEFSGDGVPVDAPLVMIRMAKPLRIMTHQVTEDEFDRCVSDQGCPPRSRIGSSEPSLPATQVNWQDATAYAIWLSAKTKGHWRLPTDEEWAFAAGARFHDDALALAAPRNLSTRWLVRYERESKADAFGARRRPVGAFGSNEFGVLDLSGNVWEWTDTCYIRERLDANGEPIGPANPNCGVRVVEGEHRAYMTDFIRDARAGGCALGRPPTHLGFRLVRDSRLSVAPLLTWLRAVTGF